MGFFGLDSLFLYSFVLDIAISALFVMDSDWDSELGRQRKFQRKYCFSQKGRNSNNKSNKEN